jgi:hypothetical protein
MLLLASCCPSEVRCMGHCSNYPDVLLTGSCPILDFRRHKISRYQAAVEYTPLLNAYPGVLFALPRRVFLPVLDKRHWRKQSRSCTDPPRAGTVARFSLLRDFKNQLKKEQLCELYE